MSESLSIGYSPCPNDCFIFYGLTHGRLGSGLDPLDTHLADVEELNGLAVAGSIPVTKVSYHAFAHVSDRYLMLPAGGALGKGVGPLIVTREPRDSLDGGRVAIPGGLTTANLLLKLSQDDDIDYVEMRYDRIMPAVAAGEVDAGLIIHESRFTYRNLGLHRHLDLGEWWEETTGHLLPLGGIAARRDLGLERLHELNEAIRGSLRYSYENEAEVAPYVARHAQELSPEVRQQHIDLYVNEYSFDVGEAGKAAVRELFSRAAARKLIPSQPEGLFLE